MCRRDRAGRVEVPVDLAGQHMPEARDQGEDLEVQAIGFDGAHDLHPPSPERLLLELLSPDAGRAARAGPRARGESMGTSA